MKHTRRALAGAVLAQAALLATLSAQAAPQRLVLRKGETLQHAIWMAQPRSLAASLRAKWLASGHTLAPSVPPVITGGAVTAATLTVGTPGEYPSMSTSYVTDTPGLQQINYVFVSPSGQSAYNASYGAPAYTASGTVNFANLAPVSLWSQPGKWTLAAVAIMDTAGNETEYDQAQLATMFTGTSFTVVNTGVYDALAPKITSGKLTPTVSLSARYPLLKGSISAADAGSGLLQAYILISPPGGGYTEYENVPLSAPLKRGVLPVNTAFSPFDTTGTWTIAGYQVCDYAFNCDGSMQDSDVVALFGTDTFTVTP